MLQGIDAVRVFTKDFARARQFYAEILELMPVFAEGDVAMFDTGETKLLLEGVDPADPEALGYVGRFTGISFRVTDAAAAEAVLSRRGVRFDGAPETQAWGGTLAHFLDPDGNVLTLVSGP